MTRLQSVLKAVRGSRRRLVPPFVLVFALAAAVPLVGNDYWTVIATRAAVYWTLVSGLTLVVGFAGQLAIGWVALLTLGAYVASVLAAGQATGQALPPFAALAVAAGAGAGCGVIAGLPALRLRTFYFAIATLGFATILTQIALAWQDVTGGGIGLPGPALPEPFDTAPGLFYLGLGIAAAATFMVCNLAASRYGRALIAIRDAEVAAEAMGIGKPRLLVMVFLVSGALAGVAGGLFASLQTYITPDAFTFDLSLLFFIAVLIGGRGSVLGPFLGTVILTLLPEFAAPLAAWSSFVYAILLLLVVLIAPGGIAALIAGAFRAPLPAARAVVPQPAQARAFAPAAPSGAIEVTALTLSFGAVRAIDGLSLTIAPGQIHGLIGPNGSGKTTILNVISGYYAPDAGTVTVGAQALAPGRPQTRARAGIARTFQTPRIVGELTALENVMIGGTVTGRPGFVSTLMALPRHHAGETSLRAAAAAALATAGLAGLADVNAGRLSHSELRFLEIARALMLRPAFVLLDEPAAGLSAGEIARLAELITAIARGGAGVCVVEHHADLIFGICDHVTVLNLGRVLASGPPAQIRAHEEVVSVYLGTRT